MRKLNQHQMPHGRIDMRKHSGVFICGFCKRETLINDDLLLSIIIPPEREYLPMLYLNVCPCGGHSIDSKIKFKVHFDPKDWRMVKCSTE
jgi:hypothetical protein